MKQFIFIAYIAVFGLISEPIFCQNILERMTKKATKKAEKELEKKIENETDEQIEKAFEEQDQESETESSDIGTIDLSKMMEKMGASSTPVKLEDNYSFTVSITIEIKAFDASDQLTSNGEIITYLNPNTESYAYQFTSEEIDEKQQDTKGVIIMDMENEACIILSDDEPKKTGIAYGMANMTDNEAWENNDETESMPDNILEDTNIKKTGRTKSILGYKCIEYLHKDDNSKTSFWITKDFKWDSKSLTNSVFKSSMLFQGLPGGFLMESYSEEFDTGEKSTYLVKNIDKSTNVEFRLASYNITNMGTMSIPTNQEE
ncbi:DUF4412 domain-containing protein [Labilibacter sediminis]|nr:DUF4412 domain-containing protein [Labilibacter sediminis]